VVEEKTNLTEIQISQEILANLRPTEKILWCDKPLFHPLTAFTFGNPGTLIAIIVFFSFFPLMFLPLILAGDVPFFILFCGVLTGVFALPFVGVAVTNILSIKNTEYVLTNQRIIIMRGALSRYLRFIDLDKILYIDVQVGMFERKYGTGNIHIGLQGPIYPPMNYQGGSNPYTGKESISSVKNPYEVHKLIKDAIEQYKLEHMPPLTIFDGGMAKRQMPCPNCKTMLELPMVGPNISIRCPACNHVFSPK